MALNKQEKRNIVVNLSHNIIGWLDSAIGDRATYGEVIGLLGRAFALAVQDYMTVYIACHYERKEKKDD